MSTTRSSPLSRAHPRGRSLPPLRHSNQGGIGIDIGSRAIKVARVVRSSTGWRLALARIVPVSEEIPVGLETLEEGTVGKLIDLHVPAAVRGGCRQAACVLPMSVVQMQTVELPSGSDRELRQMIEVELESRASRGCEFDCFENTGFLVGEAGLKMYTVFSIETEAAGGLAESLWDSGLRCERLETLPCALATAVQMVQPRALRPVAALDWGASTPTFTLISQGKPVFCRHLRECGLQSFTELGCTRFGCSANEFHELLTTCWRARLGRGTGTAGEATTARKVAGADTLYRELVDLGQTVIERLHQELHKTLGYLWQQANGLVPERIWLFGGGVLVPEVEQRLAERAGLDVRIWQLPGATDPDPWPAVFGAACALSFNQRSKRAPRWSLGRCSEKRLPAEDRRESP